MKGMLEHDRSMIKISSIKKIRRLKNIEGRSRFDYKLETDEEEKAKLPSPRLSSVIIDG